ncbi:hypothetical protein [Rhizobium sp. AG207R]|uniref:hypothetical protein n=1 Tax=Rhizobium sp. AG207R TaxID=2802287 RepID=UPI0022AC0DA6|nr:hypothetical protein [Rhizobium sp. AG207R]MCZ3378443.1 hypothetical protein [Rhizobium sp. AG207R]
MKAERERQAERDLRALRGFAAGAFNCSLFAGMCWNASIFHHKIFSEPTVYATFAVGTDSKSKDNSASLIGRNSPVALSMARKWALLLASVAPASLKTTYLKCPDHQAHWDNVSQFFSKAFFCQYTVLATIGWLRMLSPERCRD